MSGRLDLQTAKAEKHAYAVLRAGRQGTVAYDMPKFGNATNVTIGDVSIKSFKRFILW
jgi:hypothetical protein